MAAVVALLTIFALSWLSVAHAQTIPRNVLQQTSNISAQEFIRQHVHRAPGGSNAPDENLLFTEEGSFNPGGVDLISDMLVDGDNCQPKPTTVAIEQDATQPGVLLYPQCTRVMRCGGCCGHDTLECVPTRVRRVNVKVLKARYDVGSENHQFTFEGLVDHRLEEHSSCECRCRVQSYHCDPQKHTYNADICQCQCVNREQALNCPSVKIWNEAQCACVCPRIPNCLTDEFFNFATCTCERTVSGQGYPYTTVTAAADPCADVYCRPGWQPVVGSDGRCSCRIAGRAN